MTPFLNNQTSFVQGMAEPLKAAGIPVGTAAGTAAASVDMTLAESVDVGTDAAAAVRMSAADTSHVCTAEVRRLVANLLGLCKEKVIT